MKKLMLLILALCLLLGGCGSDVIPEEETELWVVTELTDKYGMNHQVNRIIGQFQEMYPNVTVRLDILPTGEEERAVYLEKLRTKIMGGAGPDVYLMPTGSMVPDPASIYGDYMQVQPLFRDVGAAMYNCIFYDVSEFYDEDEALKTGELNASVMDGGIMDGCRYVLPLRYDFDLFLVAEGADTGIFEKSADAFIASALEQGDGYLARKGLNYDGVHYFSETVDRESGRVLLTAEEVAAYMRLYQAAMAMPAEECVTSSSVMNYLYDGSYFAADGTPAVRLSYSISMDAMAVAEVLGVEVKMYPCLASDGTLKAVVEWYAAVGSGTEYPRLAYEFARMFLLEEAQYETYIYSGEYRRDVSDTQIGGWPVRTAGSVDDRFRMLQHSVENRQYNRSEQRAAQFLQEGFSLTDEDVPAVSWQVDEVRFPVIMEDEDHIYAYLMQLNDYENDCAPTDADIDSLAQEYIQKLQLYLDEG